MKKNNIIFIDTNCLMCNFFANYINILSNQNEFIFSSLNSNFANTFLNQNLVEMDTVIFYLNNTFYTKSKAIIMILRQTKINKYLIKILELFPTKMLDFFYDLISKNRRFLSFFIEKKCSLNTLKIIN